MILVGLTGGMQQGKSTVGRMLREMAGIGPEGDLETSYVIGDVANAWLNKWPAELELAPGQDVIDLANSLIKKFPPVLAEKMGREVTYEQLEIKRNPESLALHKPLTNYLEARLTVGHDTELFPTPITPENKEVHRSLFHWIGGVLITVLDPLIWNKAHDQRVKELKAAGQPFVTVGGIRAENEADMIRANGGLVVRVVRPEVEANYDLTERIMAGVKPDVEVINNGTMEQLVGVTKKLYVDLVTGGIKPAKGEPVSYVCDSGSV